MNYDPKQRKVINILNTLVVLAFFFLPQAVACIVCLIGIAYILYYIKKNGKITALEIIPLVFYILFILANIFVIRRR